MPVITDPGVHMTVNFVLIDGPFVVIKEQI